MKLVGIGDLFIPGEYIASGVKPLEALGVDVTIIDWETDGFQGLQNINLLIEQNGAEAYEVPDYIIEAIGDADIVFTQFCPINKKVIDRCPNLKVVGVFRGGYENVNVAYCTEKGIAVMNTPGRNADSVADFTVGAMICEARNIARGHLGLKNGEWIRTYPNSGIIPDLPGKTVGLIGIGEIGRKVARRLSGFDMNILVYDPYCKNPPEGVTMVDLPELMAKSDFVSLHARLTESNRHLINADMLALMKPTAYLINTSRAGLVDEDALHEALVSGKIAGAMLDVFELEPPGKDHPLVTLPNVTITPHMAGGSNDAFLLSPVKLTREFVKAWEGAVPAYVINKDCWRNDVWSLA